MTEEQTPKTKYLVFDTETGGFPSKKFSVTDDRQPPLCQIAARLITEDEDIDEMNTILKVGDRYLNPHAVAVHGMSAAVCNEKGVEPIEAAEAFMTLASKADVLVCHNFAFDIQMVEMLINRELPARWWEDIKAMQTICTMLKTTMLCNLPGRYGKPKWPKLEELHRFLFAEDFDNAHDAMADVNATVRCFRHPDVIGLCK